MRVANMRKGVSQQLSEWSHARYLSLDGQIENLQQQGRLQEAFELAQNTLKLALQEGEDAYPGADYDIAMCFFNVGRIMTRGGAAQAAIEPTMEAQQRFGKLAEGGNEHAAQMLSASYIELADCFTDLGRYKEAEENYKKAILLYEKAGRIRSVAVGKGQLGTLFMLQEKYKEAIDLNKEAQRIFEELGDKATVAGTYHQIGRTYEEMGQYSPAEDAYRKSLAIRVQMGNRSGEASSLGQLGNLLDKQGKTEDSITFT